MAKNKKGFVLYADLIHTVKKLPKEKQGDLFMVILEYVNDLNPIVDDLSVDLVFEPVKRQLKRDLKKYEKRAANSRANGMLGGRPKNIKKPTGLKNNPTEPKEPDPVTVTDTVTVKDTVKDINNRMADFKKSLLPFLEKYNSNILNEFYSYWTEHGEKDKKMRFEKEKSFGISRRLSTWLKNEKRFKEKNSVKKEKVDAALIIQRKYGLIN